jgi:hypothetical protein
MADIKVAYGSSTNITCTLASLASSATVGRESTAIDNTSNLYVDAIVQIVCAFQSGTPANDETVYIFAYGSEDGTTYTDNATGSDASITLRQPPAARLIGTIPVPDSGGLTYEGQPMRVAPAFGGMGLPRKWGIIILNYTGVTFHATEGNHSKTYTGVYYTST